jgi:uncharacterized protein YecE (DUF72 family)
VIRVGTSGWQYRDWRDRFYPRDVPQRCWLEHYSRQFETVESNNAFYRLPERATFTQWRDRTPDDFVMAVKVSRYLTHIKRLREPAEPVARFLERTAGLGRKLGPVLLQLPPTLRADTRLLAATLREFPSRVGVAVEPRHDSWWTAEIRAVLERHGAALCWADRLGRPVTPLWRTAGWGYLRLHEGRANPRPGYGRQALSTWLDRIGADAGDWYVYFNNDPGGAAVRDATTFGRLADHRHLAVSRTGA